MATRVRLELRALQFIKPEAALMSGNRLPHFEVTSCQERRCISAHRVMPRRARCGLELGSGGKEEEKKAPENECN